MEYLNSNKFIALLVIIIILAGLSGCAKPKLETQQPTQPTTIDTIGKLDAIANVLGCMFDPAPCQEKVNKENQSQGVESQ